MISVRMTEAANDPIFIRLKTASGQVRDVPGLVGLSQRNYTLQFSIPKIGLKRTVVPDQFECLLQLRMQLEPLGYRFLVNGARRNVWPSGMGRDMGGGRRAYLMQLGRPVRLSDMVDIFEPIEEADVALVPEQRAFYESWLMSLG